MKSINLIILATAIALLMICCGEKESPAVDTTSGSTIPSGEPDTVSGSTRPTDGDVVKGKIGYGSFTIGNETVQNAYGIDFNKDGVLEYCISQDGMSLVFNHQQNNVVEASGYIALISKHSTISASCLFGENDTLQLPSSSQLPEKFYVGCRITMADGVHFGWVKVKTEDEGLEWDKCAYNTVANASLTAGDD